MASHNLLFPGLKSVKCQLLHSAKSKPSDASQDEKASEQGHGRMDEIASHVTHEAFKTLPQKAVILLHNTCTLKCLLPPALQVQETLYGHQLPNSKYHPEHCHTSVIQG